MQPVRQNYEPSQLKPAGRLTLPEFQESEQEDHYAQEIKEYRKASNVPQENIYEQKAPVISHILKKLKFESVLIFSSTKKNVDVIRKELRRNCFAAAGISSCICTLPTAAPIWKLELKVLLSETGSICCLSGTCFLIKIIA